MKSFKAHLNKKLEDPKFKEYFDEEAELLEIALKVAKLRQKEGLSQKDLAEKAHVTQQQISKIETGSNCNILTLIKVFRALNQKLKVGKLKVA